MPKNHEQNTDKPEDIVLLVTGKDGPFYDRLLVTPYSSGKVDITNHGDSLFKAYNIRTGNPIVVYGDSAQSDTWGINKTAGFIQFEEDGKFHLHVERLGDHPIQAFPKKGHQYGFPSTLPEKFIKSEKIDQESFSIENNNNNNNNILTLSESMMQHILSVGLSEEGIKLVKSHIEEIEKQQPNLTSQLV
jgi:hypothetical protein